MKAIRPRAAGPLLTVLGIILVCGACIDGAMTAMFLSGATRTTGIVQDAGPGGRHATIVFCLPTREKIGMFAGGILASTHTGDRVPVLYSAANPAGSARLGTAFSLWASTVLTGLLGASLLLLARGAALTSG